jgi:hypothetical protein
MSLLGTGHTAPQAGTSAEAEALIAEARARARRRRRRIAVAVLGAVAVAAGGLAAAGGFTGSIPAATGHSRTAGAIAEPSGPPAYFMDATNMGGDYSSPEIRASATGKLVAPTPVGSDPRLDDYDPPYGLAATGPNSFVVGLMTPSDCSTQFFRLQINDRGQPGTLARVGPTLPGELTSMAASAGGGLIAYSINGAGCPKAGHGTSLGVFDPSNGRTRQWTDAPKYMTQLSMSANGRLLAFTQTLTKPAPGSGDNGFEITGYQVRVLATDAATGPVAGRSRVAASISAQDSQLAAQTVLLSPTGTSFYLCTEPFVLPKRGDNKITDSAKIVAYRTATGNAVGVLAAWTASYPAPTGSYYPPLAVSCSSMALDPSGRFLLVPYLETASNPADPSSSGSLTGARINTATGAKTDWTIPYGNSQGEHTMSVAW